jgi:PST family polysaccharide transporter
MKEILKATIKTGTGSLLSMAFGAIASKIMAVILGPGGIGLYSMLGQVNQTAGTLATSGGGAALVQGIASKKGEERDRYLRTVFWIFQISSILISTSMILLAPYISRIALGSSDATNVGLIRWLALPLALGSLLSFVTGVLNGFRAIGRLAFFSASNAAVSALLAYPISKLVSQGHEIAFVMMMAIVAVYGICICLALTRKDRYLRPIFLPRFRLLIDRASAKHFFLIAGTTTVTAIIGSVILLVVRSLVVSHSGLSGAGIFNVAWTFGFAYVMLVLGSFGTYYFPTLSLTHDKQARIDLMRKMFRVSTLLIVPLLVLAILLKPLVVQLFYSSEFLESLQTLRWMLVGDYLKTASWVMSMTIIAYADMKTFLWTEVAWWSGFLVLSTISIQGYGEMQGVGIAYLVLYVAYLVYVFHYSRSRHGFTLTSRSVATWCTGLILVGISSWQTWNATGIDWITAGAWGAVLVIFVTLSLTKRERGGLVQMLRR